MVKNMPKLVYDFKVKEATEALIEGIREWFEVNGKGCNAVLGVSGGKDSSVVAALCVKALGADRVIGIKMPNGHQHDINVANELIEFLGIKSFEHNIADTYNAAVATMKANGVEPSEQATINLAPRIRMSILYFYSQTFNGRVMNTSNLSEDWVGYATRYGDAAGDYSPLSFYTVDEVKKIGYELGLPAKFIEKVPEDGLVGKTDEDNLGIKYATLDKYLRTGECDSQEVVELIKSKWEKNWFKVHNMVCYQPKVGHLYRLAEGDTAEYPPCFRDDRWRP